ncbi:unnamed protein product [Rotaria magnacalcarata]|uniref:protein-tyrosine-phosphatase n=1 Tax=Rotaria magnacalcarata TaxID=392030 RepID=A0A814T0T5_9BILA|nr:unnamed protein product [Rotaria magnacalcarata]CAF1684514.1 unnamed protein product [Rotaria magnacalcarata]CAF1937772.1 unnamed protein product [Rotaria magnacalcarata]CAF3815794.1 unnamed protein product [Rotaria magnacalcarata]CAF3829883.1 unnamed protein product [Rotaria magnacalcarata]
MTDTSSGYQQVPSVGLSSSVCVMEDYLRRSFKATDDELNYLKRVIDLRSKRRQPLTSKQTDYSYPSVVIDDFLYHGNLGHASNIGLLNQLGIRHIVNVCDCRLDKTIVEKYNVLWINLYDELQADIKKYFDATNEFLYNCKRKNEKVLVHCQMGISRSSTIVLAYLMKYHHDSLFKAYDYLLERRRMATPNMSFFLQLIRYEKELRAIKEIDETKNNDDKQNPIQNIDPAIENSHGQMQQ